MDGLIERLDDLIHKLDGAAGRLIVAATTDGVVKEAKELVTSVSFELGQIINDLDGCND